MILLDLITSPDEAVRNRSLDAACADLPLDALLAEAEQLEAFRRGRDNLYHRVRRQLHDKLQRLPNKWFGTNS